MTGPDYFAPPWYRSFDCENRFASESVFVAQDDNVTRKERDSRGSTRSFVRRKEKAPHSG